MVLRVGEKYSSNGSGPYSRGERDPVERLSKLLGDPLDTGTKFVIQLLVSSLLRLGIFALGYLKGAVSVIDGNNDEATVLALVTGRECIEKTVEQLSESEVLDIFVRKI